MFAEGLTMYREFDGGAIEGDSTDELSYRWFSINALTRH
ncbi:Uncharacterised protein [BD1-7 clade bacterium]|uniref:Uncharacterized protein n=1 Tax=BD1-7 clade bacterium TaxID=2029982 RepID=A0A5S9N6K0_9GAMM|nr:Uncharacterised protein [BD1-7 clade bacterium]